MLSGEVDVQSGQSCSASENSVGPQAESDVLSHVHQRILPGLRISVLEVSIGTPKHVTKTFFGFRG